MRILWWKKNREMIFLRHYKILLFISAILIILSYFFADIPLAKYFEHPSSLTRIVATFFTDLINAEYNVFIWVIFFFYVRIILKKEIWGNRLLVIIMSIPVSGFANWIIKSLFGRSRPELLFSHDLFTFTFFGWGYSFESFPSGHACTIGAICGAFACFYPRLSVPLWLFALLLAFSRVVLAVHYLSDIIAGVTIGLIISQWTYKMVKKAGLTLRRAYGTPL